MVRNDNAAAKKFDALHLVCSKCSEEAESEQVFEEALGRALEWDAYETAKEVDFQSPLENCPECDRETFVVNEGRCANCGFSLEGYECAICSEPRTLDDYRYGDGGLCSYHQYVTSKDD